MNLTDIKNYAKTEPYFAFMYINLWVSDSWPPNIKGAIT